MGNRPTKIHCSAPSQGNQTAENDGALVSQSANESPCSEEQATAPLQCTEVFIVHIAPKEKEVYVLVPAEETAGERPQESSEPSSEVSSVAVTCGSSKDASGGLEETRTVLELAHPITETLAKADAQPVSLDLLHEACQLLLPEGSPTPPPKPHKANSFVEQTPDCPAVSEEELGSAELASTGTLSVGMAEPQMGTKDLHPVSDLSTGTEGPGRDQAVASETDLELNTEDVQGSAEEQAAGQCGPDEAASEESLKRTAEPQPNLILVETPDQPSVVMAALGSEPLVEGPMDSLNQEPLSESDMGGEIPEEHSAVGSWKEREDLCPPKEVSMETGLQPNEQKVPGRCLEIPPENVQVAIEEQTTVHEQHNEEDDDASPEKAEDTESQLDSAPVGTSGGTSRGGSAPGMMQLAEEPEDPGHELPPTVTQMEGQESRDDSVVENMEGMTKVETVELLPVEAQEKRPAREEVQDESSCPVTSNTLLEKELGSMLTVQRLSPVEESPIRDGQLLCNVEILGAAQPEETSPTWEARLPEAHTSGSDPPQPSPKALQGTTETTKDLEEASPGQPVAEVTIDQAGSPEAQLLLETAPVSGAPLWGAHGEEEEEEEFVDATDTCGAAAWARALRAQEEHDSKDEIIQESSVGSPDP
ncbi:uncharacterized protein LOC143830831 isoform X2 [Paroedura picta]